MKYEIILFNIPTFIFIREFNHRCIDDHLCDHLNIKRNGRQLVQRIFKFKFNKLLLLHN